MTQQVSGSFQHNFYSATPSNPSGTSSTTDVMLGLAVAITPATTGKVLVIISGDGINNVASDGFHIQLRYGTGAAPANGVAATGTAFGSRPQEYQPGSTISICWIIQAIATLVVGTTYWIDIAFSSITGGTTSLENISVSAVEL